MSMPDIAKSTMLCTPSSVYFARSFLSRSSGATSSPFTICAIASTSLAIGGRLCRPSPNKYVRPMIPASVSRSIRSSAASPTVPVLVASGRFIGAAIARALIPRTLSGTLIMGGRMINAVLRWFMFAALLVPTIALGQSALAEGFSRLPSGARVVLMPADIELFEISAGGVLEPRADWTAMAATHVTEELGRRLRAIPFVDDGDPGVAALGRLHTAVSRAVTLHHFGGVTLPGKAGRLDWSLGEQAALLKEKTGADYALFTWVRD